MALPRLRVAVCSTARPLGLRKLLAVGRVGIEAAGRLIDGHEGGSQRAHSKTLPEAGSGYHGMNYRPWSTLPLKCGAAWTRAVALAIAQYTAVHGGASRVAS